MNTAFTLQVTHVSCIRQQRVVFENVCFHLQAGEILLVEGPNGSGKSSLLRLLAGLSTPTSGTITWQGVSREELHYLGHLNGIKLGLTVKENLRLAAYLAGQDDVSLTVLSRLQLDSYQNTPARYLSAGQKRRVALAKLFLIPKKLWILDEPFTALDVSTQAIMLARLEEHAQQGGMSIISSHHPITCQAPMQRVRLASC
ncbi:MAG: cytochrome c biogenesis heme-transporting ATPase CcmA [Gammaproteobacteria bacterium]|nr:MAG: cytochrome c biogenesis heme-transporting ATPase CcmA [Gammaproteobacteria bacterium]